MTRFRSATRRQVIEPANCSGLSKPLTLTAMSLGWGLVQLDVSIVNTALQSIGTSLGGGVSELQWVVSIYTVAFASLILTTGALGDRLGAKRTFMTGFALFTAASLTSGLAPTSAILIAARAVQGVGAAIMVPNSLALLNHAYPVPKARGRAVGWWVGAGGVALTAGPPVGGALIALAGWRGIFLVNLPIGLAGLWLTWRYITDTPRASRKLDLPGQAAAIGALGILAAALIEGGRLGWSDSGVIAAFGAAAILAVMFLVHERRAEEPILPLSLFRRPMFARASLIGLLVNIPFYGLIFVFSLYFQQIDGLSPLRTGLAFVPMMAVILPGNVLAPRLAERFGAPAIIAIGCLISATGCLALLGIEPGTSYWALCGQLVALGVGIAVPVPPLASGLLGSVEKSRSGVAASVFNSARQTGSVLGVALFGSLIAQASDFLFGVRAALVVSALLLVAAAIVIGWRNRGARVEHEGFTPKADALRVFQAALSKQVPQLQARARPGDGDDGAARFNPHREYQESR
jgi:MFS transporter, DHA2 family, methylenomycin A resistance protein